jgi:hypothetical protein
MEERFAGVRNGRARDAHRQDSPKLVDSSPVGRTDQIEVANNRQSEGESAVPLWYWRVESPDFFLLLKDLALLDQSPMATLSSDRTNDARAREVSLRAAAGRR